MSVIAFVPVRKGSKSIKGKNIKSLHGKPLVYWVLKALDECVGIDQVILATDGDEIAEVVNDFGFEKVQIYRREPQNASDTASTESVMLEFIENEKLNCDDIFILAQATSPFTKSEHFDEAIAQYRESGVDSLLSVVKQKRFYWNLEGKPLNYDFKCRPRRQDFDGMFMENGAFYISAVGKILASENRLSGTIATYEMPEYTGLELDEEVDWDLAEVLMRKYHKIRRNSDVSDIKLVLSDVDGVLTDAGMYYSEMGDELKKFNTYDGMAFKLFKEKGIKVGIITSEDCQLNRRRADKLKLDYQFHGVRDKLAVVQKLINELGLSLSEVTYIGDDINDIEVLENVGIAACPANARPEVLGVPGIVQLKSSGGEGAIRELYELINQSL